MKIKNLSKRFDRSIDLAKLAVMKSAHYSLTKVTIV